MLRKGPGLLGRPGLVFLSTGTGLLGYDDGFGRMETVAMSANTTRKTRTRPIVVALLLAAFIALPFGRALAVAASEKQPALIEMFPGMIDLTLEEGRVEGRLRDAPLDLVLLALGNAAGFKVVIEEPLGVKINRRFRGQPVARVVRQLLGNRPAVVLYAPAAEGTGARELAEVRLYPKGEGRTGAQTTTASGSAVSTASDRGSGRATAARTRRGDTGSAQQSIAARVPRYTVAGDLPTRVANDLARPDQASRLRALRRLARMPDAQATAALVQVLTLDPDPEVRRTAAQALGAREEASAAQALAAARNDEARVVRFEVLRMMGQRRDDRAVEWLGRVLAGDPDPSLRLVAARSLGVIKGEAARRALEAGSSDPHAAVRNAVGASLARLSGEAARE